MALSALEVKKAAPRGRKYKLMDGKGLYLLVLPTGTMSWKMRWKVAGREQTLSLGTYPEVSLAEARKARDVAKGRISSEGAVTARQVRNSLRAEPGALTFKALAVEWLAKQEWDANTFEQNQRRLELHVLPWLGTVPVENVRAVDILELLQRIERAGARETAHRVRALINRVMRYAVAIGKSDRNPVDSLKGALMPVRGGHFPGLTVPHEVGALLRAIDGLSGHLVTRIALQVIPYVFLRPGELRGAEWSEFDFRESQWRIPAKRMKMERPHIVPLAPQVTRCLLELRPLTGHDTYVFPSAREDGRSMSENTLNGALLRLGYGRDQHVPHGFRTTASTLLNERGWHADVIERQLAHVEQNKVRGVYNHADYLPERRKMMLDYADYLDGLREQGQVVLLDQAASARHSVSSRAP